MAFPMSGWDGQKDIYYLLRTPAFDPVPQLSQEQLRAENVINLRWWTWVELVDGQAAFDAHGVPGPTYPAFSPRTLLHRLEELLDLGAPANPVEVD
jgi:hypothetical protein